MSYRNANSGVMSKEPAIDWLLEEDQPSVRFYALTELLDRKGDDPEVRQTKAKIPTVGWAADLLRMQKPGGFWEDHEPKNLGEWANFLQFPAYQTTLWRAIVLSDLGLTSKDPRVRKTAEQIFTNKLRLCTSFNFFTEEVCAVGNTARMLTRFGHGEDRRVQKLFEWMLEDQRDDGGWNCAANKPGTLDCWEALAAFAAVPKSKRTRSMERAIERGAEFYLKRHLFREGSKYPPWFRFHYPTHYYYDVLVGLDVLTQLGYGGDRRMRPALQILQDKRGRDGTWAMDKVHPDIPRGSEYDPGKVEPWSLEQPGKPSKWITLTALRVLKRVERSN